MITSHDILEKTGLKSTKTLTRWYQKGVIPQPLIRTHPSGRGKIAYWPDWVLERCVRIVELQRMGHSLRSAVQTLQLERWDDNLKRLDAEPNISEVLSSKTVQITPDQEGTLYDAWLLVILAAVKNVVEEPIRRRELLAKLREANAVETTLNLARAGYNPVIVFSDREWEIVPDFVVSQRLCETEPDQGALVVAQLLPTLRSAFPKLSCLVGAEPKAWPAPKVWVKDGDTTMEYMFWPDGPIGFELIRETGTVIGASPQGVQTRADR